MRFKSVFVLNIIILIGLILSTLTSPRLILASSLNWNEANGIGSYSQDVRYSPLDSSLYATLRTSTESGVFKSTDAGTTFTNIFPMQSNRDVNAIAISSQNSNRVWISTYSQGIFKSVDGGANWIPSGLSSIKVRYLTIDPNNEQILYAGTGDINSNGGIYKSTDGGSSWSQIGASTYGNKNCLNIFVDKSNSNRVFAGSDFNLYVSNDAGNSWTALPLGNTFPPATIVDLTTSSTIYSSVASAGIYKSTDNGASWVLKNASMGASLVFRLSQDTSGDLFATRVGSGGGVWRSEDGAESWENVADPAWGGASTWGLDVKDGRIAVSVEGLGLFVADTTPTPAPTGPHPIVVIPGFGGSYSTKAFIEHQPTVQSDWQMMPFQAPAIYNPFLNALATLNYLRGDKVFFFAYDFTKSIAHSAAWLNDFLGDEVISRNPGHRVDVVGHSMGGLVIRYCFENIAGCKDKINKIVSAGTPHKGAVDGYFFWEGADLSSLDPLARFGSALLLQTYGFPTLNPVQIIHEKIPGARDFLPIFNYIAGKPYADLSGLGKNPVLASLPLSGDFSSKTLALSGDRKKSTAEAFNTQNLNRLDQVLGLWADGKPKKLTKNLGDGTVLASSSNVPGAINKSYSINHDDYLRFNKSEGDILQFLGLSPIGPIPFSEPSSVSVYYSTDPNVEIQTVQGAGEEIVQPDPNVLFVKGGKARQRKLLVKSKKDGEFEIKGFYYETGGVGKPLKPFKVKLLKNIFKNVQF